MTEAKMTQPRLVKIKIPEEVHKAAAVQAQAAGLSLGAWIARLVANEFGDRQEPPSRGRPRVPTDSGDSA